MTRAPRATIDFETRSAVSLKKHGTWRYSCHPSTEVLCLVWRLPTWEFGRTAVWHPAFPALGISEALDTEALAELFEWIRAGGLVEAHNVWFEFCVYQNTLCRKTVAPWFPPIPLRQWRCSAAKAAAHALPRALEDAVSALKLPIKKDMEGSKVMKKMTKPRKSRKAERLLWEREGTRPPRYLWWESRELLDRLIAYCRLDVLAEEGLSQALPDLSPAETEVFLMDLAMNFHGFQLDLDAVMTALKLIHREAVILNQELRQLTDGFVRKATQRAALLTWLEFEGVSLLDTTRATLEEVVTRENLPPKARRAIEILRELGRSSTAKYQAMRDWAGADGRIRGGLLFHGASTGRWSGKGVQPHNFPKGELKGVDMVQLWEALKLMPRAYIQEQYKSVMEALSFGLRGAITAGQGQQLYVADYASIEARVLLWAAEDEEALDIFRSGRDIYCEMATEIYNRPITKADKNERQLGKAAVLGCGYQMGGPKFVATAAMYGVEIDEEFSTEVVNAYRAKFWRVKEMWGDQEAAAIQAVRTGKWTHCGKMKWKVLGKFLYCQLPSGRRLAYPFPEIQNRQTSWGAIKETLTFMAVDGYTHKWRRQVTYGGMIVENQVQAISRDLMATAMMRAIPTCYSVVLSVHDELIAEAPLGAGSVPEFEHLLAECPPWAKGCPVGAEGWAGARYHK